MEVTDAQWLCSAEASQALRDLTLSDIGKTGGSLTQHVNKLRKVFTPAQAHLLLEQAELRERGKKKFAQAEQMLFTRIGLEQATDQWVSAYKAKRFAGEAVDICCGIGGDLIALADRGGARGVERDPAIALIAQTNLAAYGQSATTLSEEAAASSVEHAAAWHADPDRRPQGRRTTHVDLHSPSVETLDTLHQACPHAAIKLAPAATAPEHWVAEREFEWISRKGECRQLVVWSGDLARTPGQRRATIVDGKQSFSFSGNSDAQAELAQQPGRYLCEPDVAVLAAGLQNDLANEHCLQWLTTSAAYFTGELVPDSPLWAAFEVIDQLPLRPKTIAAYLRERSVGRLEIKHRGVSLDPAALRKQLKLSGDAAATLMATTINKKAVAFIVERIRPTAP